MSTRPTPLAGRTAVITGAGSGIGRALALRLAGHRCPLVLVDYEGESLQATAAGLEVPVLTRSVDVRDRDGMAALAAEVRDWSQSPIGGVFNNAGVALGAPVLGGPPEEHERILAINYGGVVNGVRAFLPMLLDQRDGVIVNTSSIFGLTGAKHQSAYAASKFAVRGFTESLRLELAATGVRAVLVQPGGVKTNIIRNARVEQSVGDGLTPEERSRQFKARARTTPERAAEIIHEGVDRGKTRILVGRDARLVDILVRLAPGRAVEVLGGLERLGRATRARRRHG